MIGFAAAISLLLRHWGAIERYTQVMAQPDLTAPLLQVCTCLRLCDCLDFQTCGCLLVSLMVCLLASGLRVAEDNMSHMQLVHHSDICKEPSAICFNLCSASCVDQLCNDIWTKPANTLC